MRLWPVVSVVLLNYEMSVSIYFKGWNMMAISFKFFSLFRSFLTRPHCNFVISLNYEIVIIDVCFFHSFNVWFFKFVTLPYPYPGRIKFDIISMSNNLIFPFSFLFFFSSLLFHCVVSQGQNQLLTASLSCQIESDWHAEDNSTNKYDKLRNDFQ